jgi:hypothetical protein
MGRQVEEGRVRMDINMGNVYYNGSNPNTHLVLPTTTDTNIGSSYPYDKSFSIDGTFRKDTISVKDINRAIDKTLKTVGDAIMYGANAEYAIYDEYGLYVATRRARLLPAIEKVIFNPPATIVIWKDGVKTIVKCGEGEEFNEETGLAMAIARRYSGSRSSFLKTVREAKRPAEKE